jgi:hypothetical protein
MAKTEWRMKGQYLKNCNCIATCPCDTVGRPYPHKGCEGVVAFNIEAGHFGGVKLDGLKWAGVVSWPGALHEGNGTMQPYVDERATAEQRTALLTILSGQAGGTLFEILSQVVSTVHEPKFLPIEFAFDKKKRTAHVRIPGEVETRSEPLKVPATGAEQRVYLCMPEGFEYKEMEVANAAFIRTTGKVALNFENTNSSLADVEHTQDGLVA